MTVTKSLLSKQLSNYLNHQISKEDLISWCEQQMQESTFESDNIQEIVARLGLMDAANFNVSYKELYDMLTRLGYKVSRWSVFGTRFS